MSLFQRIDANELLVKQQACFLKMVRIEKSGIGTGLQVDIIQPATPGGTVVINNANIIYELLFAVALHSICLAVSMVLMS